MQGVFLCTVKVHKDTLCIFSNAVGLKESFFASMYFLEINFYN